MTPLQTKEPGYQITRGVFSDAECDALLHTLSSAMVTRSRAGARHLMAIPEIRNLASDPRLLDIAGGELRSQPFPFRATLFEKSGKANWLVVWHQDTALPLSQRFDAQGWGPWSEKAGITYAHAPAWALERVVALRVHLDQSTANNGPLRVVPHSHDKGLLTDEEIGRVTRETGFIECHVERGGVLSMRPLLIHSSSKAQTSAPRRVLHIEYADSPSLGCGIELTVC